MRAQEAVLFSNIAATPAAFNLRGGKYAVAALATFGGGNIHLQVLLPDGSTYLDVGSTTNFTANGFAVVDLPPGSYKAVITTSTAVYFSVTRIPGE